MFHFGFGDEPRMRVDGWPGLFPFWCLRATPRQRVPHSRALFARVGFEDVCNAAFDFVLFEKHASARN